MNECIACVTAVYEKFFLFFVFGCCCCCWCYVVSLQFQCVLYYCYYLYQDVRRYIHHPLPHGWLHLKIFIFAHYIFIIFIFIFIYSCMRIFFSFFSCCICIILNCIVCKPHIFSWTKLWRKSKSCLVQKKQLHLIWRYEMMMYVPWYRSVPNIWIIWNYWVCIPCYWKMYSIILVKC